MSERRFRHACVMQPAGTDYTLAVATVAGAVIGFAGTALASWQQDHRARNLAQRTAIEKTLTAADDLLAAVGIYRAGGGALYPLVGAGVGLKTAPPPAPMPAAPPPRHNSTRTPITQATKP